MRVIHIGLFASLLLAGCSSSSPPTSFESVDDLTAPTIISQFPEFEGQASLVNSNQAFRYLFSEELSSETLAFELFASVDGFEFDDELVAARPTEILKIDNALLSVLSEETQVEFDDIVTAVNVGPPSGQRFALNTNYVLRPSSSIRDLSDVLVPDPTTGEVREGNLIELSSGAARVEFSIVEGEWKNNGDLLCPGVSDERLAQIYPALEQDVASFTFARDDAQGVYVGWVSQSPSTSEQTLWVSQFDTDSERLSRADLSPVSSACDAGSSDNDVPPQSIPLSSDGVGVIVNPVLGVTQDDTLVLAWQQFSSALQSQAIFFSFYDGVSWLSEPVRLDGGAFVGSSIDSLELDVNQTGAAVLTWIETSDSSRLRFARLALIDEAGQRPQVTVAAEGELAAEKDSVEEKIVRVRGQEFLLLTLETIGARSQIFSRRYFSVGETSWQVSAPDSVSAEANIGELSDIDFAVNSRGDGFGVWLFKETLRDNVWISRLSGGNWSGLSGGEYPRRFELDDRGNALFPSVSVSFIGRAAIVWGQEISVDGPAQLVSRYLNPSSESINTDDEWQEEITLSRDLDSGFQNVEEDAIAKQKPFVQFDYEGDVTVSWLGANRKDVFSTWRSRYKDDWEDETLISSQLSEKEFGLAHINRDGRVLAIFSEREEDESGLAPQRLKMNLFDQKEIED